MSKVVKMCLIVLGVVCIITAIFGLFYNYSSLTTDLSGAFSPENDQPYFRQALYIMLTICTACYGLLIFFGIMFLRRNVRYVWFFVSLMTFEIIYFFILSLSWLILPTTELKLSVAGATGVANGGLMAQFIVLLPLWGSIAAIWAKKKTKNSI